MVHQLDIGVPKSRNGLIYSIPNIEYVSVLVSLYHGYSKKVTCTIKEKQLYLLNYSVWLTYCNEIE